MGALLNPSSSTSKRSKRMPSNDLTMGNITWSDKNADWTIHDSAGNQIYQPSTTTWATGTFSAPTITHQVPWVSDDNNEWTGKDNQEAARYGWFLVEGDNDTPHLTAWANGSKAEKSDEEIFTDCLEHSLTGDCPIAFKVLSVLTRNRSPYSEYEDAVKAMAENYDGVDNG